MCCCPGSQCPAWTVVAKDKDSAFPGMTGNARLCIMLPVCLCFFKSIRQKAWMVLSLKSYKISLSPLLFRAVSWPYSLVFTMSLSATHFPYLTSKSSWLLLPMLMNIMFPTTSLLLNRRSSGASPLVGQSIIFTKMLPFIPSRSLLN